MKCLICKVQEIDKGLIVLKDLESDETLAIIEDYGFFGAFAGKDIRMTAEDASVPETVGFRVFKRNGKYVMEP